MSQAVFEKIKRFLDSLNIAYKVFEHEAAATSEVAAKVREELWDTPAEEIIKRSMKALILRSRGRFFQFVLPGDSKLDFKKVKKILKSDSVSLATPEEVKEVVDCVPGEVPPFGNLFCIPVYLDFSLTVHETVNFTAGLKPITIRMRYQGWKKAVKPVVVDFVKS